MAGIDGTLKIGLDSRFFVNQVRDALNQAQKFDFKFNTRSLQLPLGRITADVSKFTDSLAAANQRVLAFGASASVIAAFTRGMAELANSTVAVEKAFADINSVFALTNNELNKFKVQVFDVARNTAQSFETTAKAALEFSRQGLGVTDTLDRINQAQILTRLSGLDATKSVESLTAVLNAYRREGLTAAVAINKLVAVDSKFAVSAGDLVEALSRVGSTAQDAGVGFDSLISLVTTAQQITARGGSEIGNALKSIFTRINRPEVLDQLEDFGIKVRTLGGDALAADTILKNIGANFANLSKEQQGVVSELSAGIFQINQFKSLVGELARSYNSYTNALEVAKGATNEATLRNEALNKSLSAVLQNFRTSATEIGSILGSLTFADPLKNLLGNDFLGSVAKQFKNIGKEGLDAGDQIGANVAEGILKGIGNVISTSGGLTIGIALFKIISKLGITAFKDLGNILAIRSKETQAMQGLNTILAQSTSLEQQRFIAAKSVAEQEQIVLSILNRQLSVVNALKARDNGLITGFSPRTIKTLRGVGAADGYVPNLVAKEVSSVQKGVGGAPRNARPVIMPNFAFGGGKTGTVVANTSEYIVPNYSNGGSAVFNQDMVRSMGLPAGAKKISAAGGFTPVSFKTAKRPSDAFETFLEEVGPSFLNNFSKIEAQDPKLARFIRDVVDARDPKAQAQMSDLLGGNFIQYTPEKYGLGTTSYLDLSKKPSEIRAQIDEVFSRFSMKSPRFAEGFTPNFAGGRDSLTTLFRGVSTNKFSEDGLQRLDPLNTKNLSKSNSTLPASVKTFENLVTHLLGSRLSTAQGVIPTSRSLKIAKTFGVFNRSTVTNRPAVKNFSPASGEIPFDNSGNSRALIIAQLKEKNIFKDPDRLKKIVDRVGVDGLLKLSNSVGGIGIDSSLLKKYYRSKGKDGHVDAIEAFDNEREVSLLNEIQNPRFLKRKGSAFARGFLPSGLGEALAREQAAGLSPTQIYVDSDSRVKNSGNPFGLLVANKRDEPIGGFQGVNRTISQGKNPRTAGAAGGYVPNFVQTPKDSPFSGLGLIGSKGNVISVATQDKLDKIFVAYGSAIEGGAVNLAAANKSYIKELDLNTLSLAAVRDVLLLQAKSIRADIIERQKNSDSASEAAQELAQAQEIEANLTFDAGNAPIFTKGERGFLGSEDINDSSFNAFTKQGQLGDPDPDFIIRAFGASQKKIATQLEESLKKNLNSVTDQNLDEIVNSFGGLGINKPGRQASIKGIREGAFVETAAVRSSKGLQANTTRSDSVVALGKAETFQQQFETNVKGLIDSGITLEKAYIVASQKVLDSGAKSTQLGSVQEKAIFSLIAYERSVKEATLANEKEAAAIQTQISLTKSNARGSNSRNLQLRDIDSKISSGGFDSLNKKQKAVLTGQFRKDSIQELGLDTRGLRGDKTALSAINNLVQQKIQGSQSPVNQAGIIDQLKKQTRLFGNFDKTAENIISGGKFNQNQKDSIRGSARGLGENRSSRLQNFGFGASFALPFLGGAIASQIPNAEGGTTKGKVAGGIEGASSGVGLGATIGSLFGPVGTAIGATLGGAIGLVIGVSGKARKSFEELAQATQLVESRNSRLLDGLNQYAIAQQDINDVISKSGSKDQLQSARSSQRQIANNLPAQFRSELARAGADVEKIGEVLRAAAKDAANENRRSQAVAAFSALREKPTVETRKTAINLLTPDINENTDFSVFFNAVEQQSAAAQKALERFNSGPVTRASAATFAKDSRVSGIVDIERLVKEFEKILNKTALTEDQQKEIITQLRGSKSGDIAKTLSEFAKIAQANFAASKGDAPNEALAASSLNIRKEFDKAVEGIREFQLASTALFNYAERFRAENINAALNTGALNSRQSGALQNSENLRSTIESSNQERQSSFSTAIADFTSSLGRERATQAFGKTGTSVAEAIQGASSASDLEKIIKTVFGDTNSATAKELRAVVLQLRQVENNTGLQIDLAVESNKIQSIQNAIAEQQKFLNSGGFDAQTIASLNTSRVEGSSKFSSDIFRANKQLDFSRGLDSLGIAQSDNTLKRQRDLQGISAKGTLAGISGDLLKKQVGTDDASLRGAAEELSGSSDKNLREVGKRLIATLDNLSIDIEAETQKFLNADPKANVDALFKSGKITLGDQVLTTGIRETADNTFKAVGLLEQLARLYAQQEDATSIRDFSLQLDSLEKLLNQQIKEGVPTKVLSNTQDRITTAKAGKALAEDRVINRTKEIDGAQLKINADSNKVVRILNNTVGNNTNAQKDSTAETADLAQKTNELSGTIESVLPNGTVALKPLTVDGRDPLGPATETRFDTFKAGFGQSLKAGKEDLQSFAEEGRIVGASLRDNLGGAFGDFVTGAKSGKDAFRDFVLNVLNDAARAFASQAVTRLLGSAFGGAPIGAPAKAYRGGPIGRNRGGDIPKFAGGGRVPAMLTGGEYVLDPNTARTLGPSMLNQLNNGTLAPGALSSGRGMNSYGMVSGGSGLRDDVPASLQSGSYVIKKSSVNKYGPDMLNTLNGGGKVQKKFIGGAILGALVGGGLGYATGGKKGALIGAIGGGVLGGVAQNAGYLKGIGLQSNAAKAASSAASGAAVSSSSAAGAAASKAASNPLRSALFGLGASVALGLAFRASGSDSPSEGRAMTNEEITAERIRLEQEQAQLVNTNLSQDRYAYLGPDQSSIASFGAAPATRRFSGGGMATNSIPNYASPMASMPKFAYGGATSEFAQTPVHRFNGGPISAISTPVSFAADGGPIPNVSASDMAGSMGSPVVSISVTINNNGGDVTSETSTSLQSDGDMTRNKEFGLALSSAIEKKVNEAIADQYRNGGTFQQLNRQGNNR